MSPKYCILIFYLLITGFESHGQSYKVIDSLKTLLLTTREDTNKVNVLIELSRNIFLLAIDNTRPEAKRYAEEAMALSNALHYKHGIADAYFLTGVYYNTQGKKSEALENYFNSIDIMEEIGDKKGLTQAYDQVGSLYQNQGQYSEALQYYQKALQCSTEIGYKKGMGLTYNFIGGLYSHQNKYSEALQYLMLSLKIRQEIGDSRGMAACYTNIGVIYKERGNYSKALENYLAALEIHEASGFVSRTPGLYENIGNIYNEIGNYEEAIKYHKLALTIWESYDDHFGLAVAYSNLGDDFARQGNTDEALRYYQAALTTYEALGRNYELALISDKIGSIYANMGNYVEAMNHHLVAFKILKELNNKGGLVSCCLAMGSEYLVKKQYAEARQYLSDALTMALEIGMKAYIRDAYQQLAQLEAATGNHVEAFRNFEQYVVYKDSLLNETSNQQIAQMKEQYDSEKKDKEIIQLNADKQQLENEKNISDLLLKTKQDSLLIARTEKEKINLENEKFHALNLFNQQQLELLENEKQLQFLQIEKGKSDFAAQKAEADKKQVLVNVLQRENDIQQLRLKKQRQAKHYFMAGLALVLVVSFLIYRNYHNREEVKLLTLRNKIASDLHDDIGSTLSSISIFSQMTRSSSEEAKLALDTIGESSRKMLDAMADIVWTINPENDQFEKIIMRMRGFAYELLGAKQIEFDFDADDEVNRFKLPMDVRKNLYLIFKEATNNMVKYAEANKAYFTLKAEKAKMTMTIRDNGKGFDTRRVTTGNGLKNMKKRAADIGALLWIDSTPSLGTTIKVELTI